MAYSQRRRGKAVTVYYYDIKTKKNVPLPREETEHLDSASDDEVKAWVEKWEDDHGVVRNRIDRVNLRSTDAIKKYLEQYLAERKEEGVSEITLAGERRVFENHIFPYFIGKHRIKDPRKWVRIGSGLRTWLSEHEKDEEPLKLKTIKQAIQTANRFGRWLRDINVISSPWEFRSPKIRQPRTRRSPLKTQHLPKDILKTARHLELSNPSWALALLVGFFASLRGEETFALEKSDFITGDLAAKESQTYDRFKKIGLGTKLAIRINKALINGSTIGVPKNAYSNGVVTIWDKDAALLIAKILKGLPDGRIFTFHKTHLFRTFAKLVVPHLNCTPHDLRRSSGLYLGRTLGIDPWLLQDHLRHADMETTLLYTRRAGHDDTDKSVLQDFDDVV